MKITDKIDDYINERWGTDRTTPKKKQGKWDSWTLDDLKEERMRLKDKETRKQGNQKRQQDLDR